MIIKKIFSVLKYSTFTLVQIYTVKMKSHTKVYSLAESLEIYIYRYIKQLIYPEISKRSPLSGPGLPLPLLVFKDYIWTGLLLQLTEEK